MHINTVTWGLIYIFFNLSCDIVAEGIIITGVRSGQAYSKRRML